MEETLKQEPIKRFSDIAPSVQFDGERTPIENVVGKDIKILDYEILASNKFKEGGKFAVISAMLGDTKIVFNGSEVIAGQLEQRVTHDMLPIIAKISMKKSAKGQRYWCLE